MTPIRMIFQTQQHKNSICSEVSGCSILFCVLYIAVYFRVGSWNKDYTILALAAFFVYYVCAHFQEMYRSWRGQPIFEEIKTLFWFGWGWFLRY
jgi:hypothetical protein